VTVFRDIIWPDVWRASSGARSNIQASNLHINLPNRQRFVVQRYEEMFRELTIELAQAITDGELKRAYNIWNVVGSEHTFLAKDHADWNTTDGFMEDGDEALVAFTDQPLRNTITGLTTGDGSTQTFYTGKLYAEGSGSRFKRIREPIESTMLVGVGGSQISPPGSPSDWTLGTNGIVTITPAPGNGIAVTWGGEFYFPVYFPNDKGFSMSLPLPHIREFKKLVLREDLIAD
jgi:uncharacterized protein (TIGR02217 family)